MSTNDFHYVGDELAIFAHATRWKSRLARETAPYLGRHVLEVGAGLGETAKALIGSSQESWTLLEPDPVLAGRAQVLIDSGALPPRCVVKTGTTGDLVGGRRFDSVIYIDVLEHIEDDRGELVRAAQCAASGGHIVVMSPAHQWLYSEFDARIGHVRRYSRATLTAIAPPGVTLSRLRYLDAVGMLASAGNRLLLHKSLPSLQQLLFWDRRLVPLSAAVDPLLGYRLGKSILAVWRKD